MGSVIMVWTAPRRRVHSVHIRNRGRGQRVVRLCAAEVLACFHAKVVWVIIQPHD